MDGEISHADGWADAPPILFLEAPKRECAVPGGREKALRRGKVGCPLRQSGTETRCPWGIFWPGEVRDTSSFSFRCRWPVVDESLSIGMQQLLRPPGQRVAKRNARKEKLVKCVLATRRPGHHPPRDGSIDLAEGPSVPEGRAKSTLAPIRRPPYSNFAHTCKVATKAVFSFGPCTARFLFHKMEKKMGGASPHGPCPLREQGLPRPPSRRLLHTPWRVHCPAINIAAIPRPTGRLRPSSIPKISKF